MKVYSLLGFVDYEGSDLIGVFGSVEDVMECASKMERNYGTRYEYFDQIGYIESELGQRIDDVLGEIVYIPE